MIIHQKASENTYNFFRNWILGIWLALIVFSPVLSLAKLSFTADYSAGFLLKYLPDVIKEWLFLPAVLIGIKGVLILGLGCMLFRRFSTPAGFIVCFLLTVYQGMMRGIGEPNHGELSLLYGIYFLVLFEWADRFYSSGEKNDSVSRYGLPLTAICAALCFTYTYIGLHRLANGGIDLYFGDSIYYWIIENSHEPKAYLFWKPDIFLLEHQWVGSLIKAGFPVFTALEIIAPLALVNKPFRTVFVIGMAGFHLFNWLFMGILFWENILMLALFIEFPKRSA